MESQVKQSETEWSGYYEEPRPIQWDILCGWVLIAVAIGAFWLGMFRFLMPNLFELVFGSLF